MSTAEVFDIATKGKRGPKPRVLPSLDKKRAKATLDEALKDATPMGKDGIQFCLIKITPTLAETMLLLNAGNRNISNDQVLRYADEMRRDGWLLTHQAIAFDKGNYLLDGQHRLRALIKAERALPFIVARGFARDTFKVCDVGMKRSPNQLFALAGYTHTKSLSAGAQTYLHVTSHEARTASKASFTARLAIVEKVPALVNAADLMEGQLQWVWRHCGRIGAAVACHTQLAQWQGAEEADKFFWQLNDGANLPKGSPMLLLRDDFATLKAQQLTQPWWMAWGKYQQTIRAIYNGGELKRFKRIEAHELVQDINIKPAVRDDSK